MSARHEARARELLRSMGIEPDHADRGAGFAREVAHAATAFAAVESETIEACAKVADAYQQEAIDLACDSATHEPRARKVVDTKRALL